MKIETAVAAGIKYVGMEPISGEVTVIFRFLDRSQAFAFHAAMVCYQHSGQGLQVFMAPEPLPQQAAAKKRPKKEK